MVVREQCQIVPKLWGEESIICNRKEYCAKWLYVKPMVACSLHKHKIKNESFHVVAGSGVIEIAGEIVPVSVGDTVQILPDTYHCFATADGMTLLEVSTTHSDQDVIRCNASSPLDRSKHRDLWKALGLPEDD